MYLKPAVIKKGNKIKSIVATLSKIMVKYLVKVKWDPQ